MVPKDEVPEVSGHGVEGGGTEVSWSRHLAHQDDVGVSGGRRPSKDLWKSMTSMPSSRLVDDRLVVGEE